MRWSTILFVLIAISCAALFVALGFWQLDRRGQRRARNAIIAAHMVAAPVGLAELSSDTAANHYRRLHVSGHPDFDRDIALTLRGHTGSPGVDILTPLRIAGSDSAVLVNRGWIYAPDGMTADLSRWRETDTSYTGYLEEFETGTPGDSVRANGIRRMNYDALSRVLPYPIRKFYVVATTASFPPDTAHVVRLAPPPLDEGPHFSYALQWFSFAAIAIVGAGVIVAGLEELRMADTTHIASEQEARDVAEAARESDWSGASFARDIYLGKFSLNLIHPAAKEDPAEAARAKPFMDKLREFLTRVDSDMIDRTGEIPESYVNELRAMGAFGIKIPKEYGGLGLHYSSYVKAMALVTSKDGSLTALLSAHQSIGLPQPLALFGTDEQKKKYFPRLAKGAISAFALTEVDAGSDPANLRLTATPTPDGKHFVLNGEKLWTTNGTRAELFLVMAKSPDAMVNGKAHRQITAFIVEKSDPGVEVMHRCRFMGLKAIENGVIRFTNVKVPRENILWGEGKGLKLALITLNTGRLTLPASVAGGSKALLEMARTWAMERVQWGAPIGKHEAVAQKIAMMAANTFAMESISALTVALVERGNYDVRLEAAIAKMYNTEHGWRIVDDALQIRGGRGYETADSLRARGEKPIPVERAMRDSRINLIFEGSSEIMRLFIAREAVDHHFKTAFALVDPKSKGSDRWAALGRVMAFYPRWYPARWIGRGQVPGSYHEFGPLAGHLRFAERHSRKLGRALFHAMVRFGPKLERRQLVLFRGVDIGAELFAMAATCVRAHALAKDGQKEAIALADLFCREARRRINRLFDDFYGSDDGVMYAVAQQVLRGEHAWMEQGIMSMLEAAPGAPPASDQRATSLMASTV